MARSRLAVGRFVRITSWDGTDLPAPVWGEVIWASEEGDDSDVAIFCNVEVWEVVTDRRGQSAPLDIYSTYTVHTLDRLPGYVLAALAKRALIGEG